MKKELKIKIVISLTAALLLIAAAGCNEPIASNSDQLNEFNNAGPITPKLDIDQMIKAKKYIGIYEVTAGDILEMQLPGIIRKPADEISDMTTKEIEPYFCRISDQGTVTLPIIGELAVEGLHCSEIEAKTAQAYWPKYVVNKPSVVCKVFDYRTENVSIVGAVEEPGVYPLQSNEMSVVSLLMKAGGIIEDGASIIIIERSGLDESVINYDNIYEDALEETGEEETYLEEYVFITEDNEEYLYEEVQQIELSEESFEQTEPQPVESNIGQIDEIEEYLMEDSSSLIVVSADEQSSTLSARMDIDILFHQENSNTTEGQLIICRRSTMPDSNESDVAVIYADQLDIASVDECNKFMDNLSEAYDNTIRKDIARTLEQLAIQITGNADIHRGQTAPAEEFVYETEVELYEQIDYIDEPQIQIEHQNEYITETQAPVEPIVVEDADQDTDDIEPVTIEDAGEDIDDSAEIQLVQSGIKRIMLPVKGLNIPFADIELQPGDIVKVEKINPQVFTVMGHANQPGAFPYPPNIEYNLMQAISFAGGINLIADPHFVTVYRQDNTGRVVHATFNIKGNNMADTYTTAIKPGDVICIEVTQRTRTNLMLAKMLKFNFGAYYRAKIDSDD